MKIQQKSLSLFLFCVMSLPFGCSTLHKSYAVKPQNPRSEVFKIEKLTVWYPAEGSCSNGGPLHGKFDACKYRLEDYLEGRAPCVLAATQQTGGTASLYGCRFFIPALQRALGSKNQIRICAADVYAKSEDFGKIGVSGNINGSKLDIALREGSEYAAVITAVPPIEVRCEEEIL